MGRQKPSHLLGVSAKLSSARTCNIMLHNAFLASFDVLLLGFVSFAVLGYAASQKKHVTSLGNPTMTVAELLELRVRNDPESQLYTILYTLYDLLYMIYYI